MNAIILDGKTLAAQAEDELRPRVAALVEARGRAPTLATVLVGDDPASATYVRMKGEACRRVGLEARRVDLPADTDTAALLAVIDELNNDDEVCGVLLQHPTPPGVDERACFDAIHASKDVDGVGALGFGRMSLGVPAWGSATPTGIMRLLRHHDIAIAGRRAVVVGRSPILGKPMGMMLLGADATLTWCHSRSRDLPSVVGEAELLVAAVGKPRFIRREWIRPGAVVVDAGYHPAEKCGDVDLDGIEGVASAYTPVPGGVGPMTINTLISQAVAAAEGARAD